MCDGQGMNAELVAAYNGQLSENTIIVIVAESAKVVIALVSPVSLFLFVI